MTILSHGLILVTITSLFTGAKGKLPDGVISLNYVLPLRDHISISLLISFVNGNSSDGITGAFQPPFMIKCIVPSVR